MLQEPALKQRETSINNDSLDGEKQPLTLKMKSSSENKQGSDTNIGSNRVIQNIEDDSLLNKKSAFGKNNKGGDRVVIDFNKKEVNLQNSEDQQALIHILKKEVRNKKEIQFIDRAVNQLKFFSEKKIQLNEKLYGKLLEKLKYQFLEKEKPLFYHGDKGDKYYIVLKGSLILLIPPKPFEEAAAIDEQHQQRLKEKYFRLKDHPEYFLHRNTIATMGACEEDQVPRSPNINSSGTARNKAQTIGRYINTALKFTFNNVKPQTPTAQSPLNVSGSTPSRKQSQRFKGADFEAEMNTIENTFDLYCQAFFPNCKNAFTFHAGAGFGEIALIRKTERSGTVVGSEDCHLMTLDKDSFDEILGRWEREKTDEQLNFLKSFSFFKDVNEKYLMGLLHSMKEVTMIRNEVIYREDESPENVYFIRGGEIELSKLCQIQKTETLQQQLDKEEIDTLIRGNSESKSQQKNKILGQNEQQLNKKLKSDAKVELNKKDRKTNENGTRVKFSVISQPCYFGDEEILMEIPTRNHMAKVLSTTADMWVIDKKSFYQLLKQQRTFKTFQDQCKAQIVMRNKRLEKISSTIKKEEDKFLITTYRPKHGSMRVVNSEQSLITLIKQTEEESLHHHLPNQNHNRTSEEIENNQNYHNMQSQQHQTHSQFYREGQTFITNESNHLEEKNNETTNSQKLLQYFSRNNYLDQLAQVSSKKMKILKEISQKGIGFNGSYVNQAALQSSLAEFDEDLTTSIVRTKNSIPYQKNLLFQLNVGNGIRKGQFRDPFQTYDEQQTYTSKGLKSTQSVTNLYSSSDIKRNTLHNLYTTPRSNAVIKPILEKFEREQIKSGYSSHREEHLKKLYPSKNQLNLDSSFSRHKARNSLRVVQPALFNSVQSSITQINEFNEENKNKFVPFNKNQNQNLSSDTLNITEKGKSKYQNIQELIQESKQQLQSISEDDKQQLKPTNIKKNLKKMKSDIQFENDYLLNTNHETKHKSNQNSANIVSIQLLHETEEDAGSSTSFIQSKGFKPSIHSLAALTPSSRNTLKPLGEKQQKFEFNEKVEQGGNNNQMNQMGKVSRSSFQEQFSNQNNKKIISTLNLNASENAFDSFKILLTEEGGDQDENLGYSPSNVIATSPSHQIKSIGFNSFRNTTSNIHMEKLRKQNQPKHLNSTHFVNNFNKMKTQIQKKFKENQQNFTESSVGDGIDFQKQLVTNAFKTKSGVNHMFKKAYQNKK